MGNMKTLLKTHCVFTKTLCVFTKTLCVFKTLSVFAKYLTPRRIQRCYRVTSTHLLHLYSPSAILQTHSFLDYLEVLLLSSLSVKLIFDYHWFPRYGPYVVELLKQTSIVLESCLALPQAVRNHRNASTRGLSAVMVGGWVAGDFFKLCYFLLQIFGGGDGKTNNSSSNSSGSNNVVFVWGCLFSLLLDSIVGLQVQRAKEQERCYCAFHISCETLRKHGIDHFPWEDVSGRSSSSSSSKKRRVTTTNDASVAASVKAEVVDGEIRIKTMSTYPDGIVHQPPYNSIGMNNINDIDAEDKSNIQIRRRPRQKMDQCRVPSEPNIVKAKQNTNTGVFGRVDELRAFKKKHGHLSISRKDDRSLYNFCYNIRQSR